ncbi:sigma-70 family RNA polymerase sigma factor [Luteolibacter sp. GHJ8]|uniref:Sigma-70 family RNA polymerase sigma factor n=1 Tax=Luteolibacter rhizosphaerae TaxID=2989719 RepID=A0ABT3G989_9BACT|nr:sigma-70 family RNA polymerase sigma factor [Luteolibacter rhizosphaerae]MCW1916421.1 sigma-70 family RNA polymerase sigma factor [Luteolibacter rhizosphaerae]
MTEQSDDELLQDWCAEGSERAFAELARRYGGLLYHTALRRTGRSDLAGEAAQGALLILARKAKGLREVPNLAGWLHRTVCYEASKLQRRERRHDARMKHMPSPDGPEEETEGWKEAAPLLDQALDGLPAKDREVIFLRYFEGLSFEEMARRFGGESATWRQRGSRAVEKLRVRLGKRGAAVSGAVLASGLGSGLSQAAPAPVLASLASSPAAGAAAISWTTLTSHSLHLMKLHPATPILATLLLAALPLTLQAIANASARERVARLEMVAGDAPPLTASETYPVTSNMTVRNKRHDVLWLADAIEKGSKGSRPDLAKAERMIQGLSADELDGLLREAIDTELPSGKRRGLISKLLLRYAHRPTPDADLERIVRTSEYLADHLGREGQDMVWGWTARTLNRWATADPQKAMAWYRDQIRCGRLDYTRVNLYTSADIYAGLMQADPRLADEFYATLPEDQQFPIANRFNAAGAEKSMEMAAKFDDPERRQSALRNIFQYGTKDKEPGEVRAWVDRAGACGQDAAELLGLSAAGDPYTEGVVSHLIKMKTEEIAERIAWLQDPAMGEESAAAVGFFLAEMMKSVPENAGKALDAEWERNPDQQMLESYMRNAGSSARAVVDALDRYRYLSNTATREEILRELLSSPGGQEVLAKMRERGISQEDLDEAQLPAELFR